MSITPEEFVAWLESYANNDGNALHDLDDALLYRLQAAAVKLCAELTDFTDILDEHP